MKKIKMIGFDLDGTLLTTKKVLTERTKRALIAAAARGVMVLPVTGRPLSGLPRELLDMPVIRYAVTANGARVLEVESGKVMYEKLVPVENARQILDIFEEYDTLRDIYYDGIGYAQGDKLEHVYDYVGNRAMGDYILSTRRTVPDVRKKFEEENRGLDKVQALFRNQEDKLRAWEQISTVAGVEVTGALENNIEVNAAGVNKGIALVRLGELFGIEREEIMAFGDGANDKKMLEKVGIGVAMSNAVPEVKEIADYMTVSNDEEGVAKFIEEHVLR